MDVYFPFHTFRFLACIYCLFNNCMFWYVYMLYPMYSPKGGNKEYLSRSSFDHHLRCVGWLNFEFSKKENIRDGPLKLFTRS